MKSENGYMEKEIARHLAKSKRSLVVAPAGCGKTRLIADAVRQGEGRQLILTHTHAGVRAMLNHLKKLNVSSGRFRVSTIDSFALKYANAFPCLSGWANRKPEREEWKLLHPAAQNALKYKNIRKVFTSSYEGVYVDEYQDCSSGQHELITLIADILPCRILGDPMQAIFRNINKDKNIDWKEVENVFEKTAELSTPWRWKGNNEKLGNWLLSIRKLLENGNPVDLQKCPTIKLKLCSDHQTQVSTCLYDFRNTSNSVVAIRKMRQQCNKLTRYLKNTFSSMETVECQDLLNWAKKIGDSTGADRLKIFIDFTKLCISRLPNSVVNIAECLCKGKKKQPRRPDFQRVVKVFKNILRYDDLCYVELAFDAIEKLQEKLVFARRELWRDMCKTIQHYDPSKHESLEDKAWHVRDMWRKIGRNVDKRVVSTTLLVKGLEFDNAIILNANEFEDAENFYVAMTRGSNSLTILTKNPVIQFPKPHYLS